MRSYQRSQELYERAARLMPGGVNSPVRSFRSVGRSPLFIARGQGARIFDVDGNEYIDYVMSYGPLIFGHAPPRVLSAVASAAQNGTSFGATTAAEVEFAEKMISFVPSLEKVRLVNSGTEAVMSAVRAARGFTHRDKVLKFDGCYHGHSDGLLSSAGSGVATFDLPGSAGVPVNLTRDTITVPFNDFDLFREAMRAHEGEIACVLVEPVAANMGVVPAKAGFLELLRAETKKASTLLIFDEVITGFRMARGGAQELFGISPDLTCLGKIAGGGLPLAAYGGRAEVMDSVAPVGPVYQAGTLSGNPVAVAAGLEVLRMIDDTPDLYDALTKKMRFLSERTAAAAEKAKLPFTINTVGSIMTLFFSGHDVTNYRQAKSSDTGRYAAFFKAALDQGISLAPSQFEAMFVSYAHTQDDLEETAQIIEKALLAA